jgi:hypothetical protein
MILEGLVTTTTNEGQPHLAPMGPRVNPSMTELLLRPFPTSQTYRNLKAHGEGVFHITDDAALMARSALGLLGQVPQTKLAQAVEGWLLPEACRAYEFRVRSLDESGERVHIQADIVHTHRFRDFLGFHRAKHALLEAAILATRLHLIPADEVDRELARLRIIIDKTAGPDELTALSEVNAYVQRSRRRSEEGPS